MTATSHASDPSFKGEGRVKSLTESERKPAAFLRFNANPQNAGPLVRCERASDAPAPAHARVRTRESNLPRSLKMSINQFAHQEGQRRSKDVRDLFFTKISEGARAGAKIEELTSYFIELQSHFVDDIPKT